MDEKMMLRINSLSKKHFQDGNKWRLKLTSFRFMEILFAFDFVMVNTVLVVFAWELRGLSFDKISVLPFAVHTRCRTGAIINNQSALPVSTEVPLRSQARSQQHHFFACVPPDLNA